MKLFQLFGKKEKKEGPGKYTISLDIGTEILKGLLYSTTDLGVEVWKSFHVKQQTHAMRSGVIKNAETVIENARMVVNKLIEPLSEDEKPYQMMLGMAGELVNGISITVSYDRGKESGKKVSERDVQQMIDNVFADILTKGKIELAKRLDIKEDDVEVLQITLTGILADKIRVLNLIGTTPKEVTLYLYASFAPKQYLDTLKTISKELNLEIAGIVTQPFAVARAFSGSSDSLFSGIFVDIGGGTTDVALVHNGYTIQTKMYAFGGRAFTNKLVKTMDLDYNIAEARKIKYAMGELPLDLRDEIRRIFAPDVHLWVETLEIALAEFGTVNEFPGQFYLCGGGAMLPDIKEAILGYPWHKKLPFKKIPKVNIVTPDRLERVYDKSGTLVNPYDVTPTALAKFHWDVLNTPELHYVGKYN